MLNSAPIFINGFPRGGTTLLQDIVASHPEVGLLHAETHQVFYGRESEARKKWVNRAFYAPVMLATGQHLFRLTNLEEREPVSPAVARYIDLRLFLSKVLFTRNRHHDGVTRPWSEIMRSRLLGKNMNGLAFTTPLLSAMYPDVTFFALVRNGLALCEGWMRRGKTPEYAGYLYRKIGERMLDDAAQMKNYHILRFEDLIANPLATIVDIHDRAGLELCRTSKIGLESRASMGKDGVRRTLFGEGRELVWVPLCEIDRYLRKDVNENQVARLSDSDKAIFLSQCGQVMERLGYLDN
ncbi:MAG TPA: sulfotransferase [Gemmatimonadaceae bacterium]|nr:sulfotransferase [Gemmatimonadaceae bacterium]